MKIPKGFLLSGINCGIKKKNLDLGLIYAQDFFKVMGVFTTNANPSYSVLFSKRNINKPIKAILVNSGNANCHSHKNGLKDTAKVALELAKCLGVATSNILIASTGIIGKKLPKEKIIKNMPKLVRNLSKKAECFAGSILTTDTFPKVAYAKVPLGKCEASVLGFAKGAGMICPNMATMLAFIITDVDIGSGILKGVIQEAISMSFNSISVDGCMSTNDTVFFVSSEKVPLKNKNQIKLFSGQLKKVCLNLAKEIVKDAEGASKFIEVEVKGAKTSSQAKKGALAIANSNLFKCALYGANSNWGRVVSALGQAGIKVKEDIIIKSSELKKKDVKITIDLKKGKSCWSVYTSDLTPKYIAINAEHS